MSGAVLSKIEILNNRIIWSIWQTFQITANNCIKIELNLMLRVKNGSLVHVKVKKINQQNCSCLLEKFIITARLPSEQHCFSSIFWH